MIRDFPLHDERFLDLLAAEATEGLSATDAAELASLRKQLRVESASLEHAAAVLDLVLFPAMDEMPATLKRRLLSAAEVVQQTIPDQRPEPYRASSPRSALAWSGWVVAAICLVVAVWLGWPRSSPVSLSLLEQRQQLLGDAAAGAIAFDGKGAGIRGNIIWSNTRQQGYLEVEGLRVNDPKQQQYQLWIVDGGRPGSAPVDGGVFDVSADGKVLIPIQAKLRVFDPKAFAITLEQAGGVVVSKSEHLLVLTARES